MLVCNDSTILTINSQSKIIKPDSIKKETYLNPDFIQSANSIFQATRDNQMSLILQNCTNYSELLDTHCTNSGQQSLVFLLFKCMHMDYSLPETGSFRLNLIQCFAHFFNSAFYPKRFTDEITSILLDLIYKKDMFKTIYANKGGDESIASLLLEGHYTKDVESWRIQMAGCLNRKDLKEFDKSVLDAALNDKAQSGNWFDILCISAYFQGITEKSIDRCISQFYRPSLQPDQQTFDDVIYNLLIQQHEKAIQIAEKVLKDTFLNLHLFDQHLKYVNAFQPHTAKTKREYFQSTFDRYILNYCDTIWDIEKKDHQISRGYIEKILSPRLKSNTISYLFPDITIINEEDTIFQLNRYESSCKYRHFTRLLNKSFQALTTPSRRSSLSILSRALKKIGSSDEINENPILKDIDAQVAMCMLSTVLKMEEILNRDKLAVKRKEEELSKKEQVTKNDNEELEKMKKNFKAETESLQKYFELIVPMEAVIAHSVGEIGSLPMCK